MFFEQAFFFFVFQPKKNPPNTGAHTWSDYTFKSNQLKNGMETDVQQ